MIQHDFRLGINRLLRTLHISFQTALCLFTVKLRIIFNRFSDLIKTFISGVIRNHIQNKAFFNRLLHGIKVERLKFTIRLFLTEFFQSAVFRCGGESKIRRIAAHFAGLHGL